MRPSSTWSRDSVIFPDFVGHTLAKTLLASGRHQVAGFDNFIRPGSESNRAELKQLGAKLFHADLRAASDIDALPDADWVIDAAANPSVLAGVDGQTSSRQLVEHNLGGTVNLLEFCKARKAGFILLSTSRVYAIAPLASLPVTVLYAHRRQLPARLRVFMDWLAEVLAPYVAPPASPD